MPLPIVASIIKFLRGNMELSVSRIIRRPIARVQKISRILQLTGSLTDAGLDQLIEFAQRGLDAGPTLTEKILGGAVSPADIPVQPYLFGDDPAGRNLLLEVDVFHPGVGQNVSVTLELGDVDELQDLQQIAAEELARRVSESPGKFNNVDPEDIQAASVVVRFAERRS